jgi:hypothetical protein
MNERHGRWILNPSLLLPLSPLPPPPPASHSTEWYVLQCTYMRKKKVRSPISCQFQNAQILPSHGKSKKKKKKTWELMITAPLLVKGGEKTPLSPVPY